jgi:excisionase family DNA binding protein
MARTPISTHDKLMLTTAEAAELLGVSRDIFRADIAPELRGVPIRGSFRWPRAELVKWLDRAAQGVGTRKAA